MRAHLFYDRGHWEFSGHNACGDPWLGIGDRARETTDPRPFDLIVDVGREFILTWDGFLYLTGPGPAHFATFTPVGLVLAARRGWFGFQIVHDSFRRAS